MANAFISRGFELERKCITFMGIIKNCNAGLRILRALSYYPPFIPSTYISLFTVRQAARSGDHMRTQEEMTVGYPLLYTYLDKDVA